MFITIHMCLQIYISLHIYMRSFNSDMFALMYECVCIKTTIKIQFEKNKI